MGGAVFWCGIHRGFLFFDPYAEKPQRSIEFTRPLYVAEDIAFGRLVCCIIGIRREGVAVGRFFKDLFPADGGRPWR